MKRDMDLVRRILLAMESDIPVDQMRSECGVDETTFFHHCWLLSDAELIVGSSFAARRRSGGELPMSHPLYITWKGHEFVDASRDPTRWEKAKRIATSSGNWSFDIVKSVLSQLALQQVNLSLGLTP